MKRLIIAVLIALVMVLGGAMLYRHFVTNRIMDKDGMENPYADELTQEDDDSAESNAELREIAPDGGEEYSRKGK